MRRLCFALWAKRKANSMTYLPPDAPGVGALADSRTLGMLSASLSAIAATMIGLLVFWSTAFGAG
jgi:hypothetical protein